MDVGLKKSPEGAVAEKINELEVVGVGNFVRVKPVGTYLRLEELLEHIVAEGGIGDVHGGPGGEPAHDPVEPLVPRQPEQVRPLLFREGLVGHPHDGLGGDQLPGEVVEDSEEIALASAVAAMAGKQ